MKRILLSSLAAIGLIAFTTSSSFAADADSKPITIKGEGKCGKCALKETAACQNVIEVDKGKKKGTYYLVQNEVSKSFHDNICKESKKVKATGTVQEVNGKKQFTATKIELE